MLNNIYKIWLRHSLSVIFLILFNMAICHSLGLTKDENPFSLKINQEIFLTDKNGIFMPTSILSLTPGCAVRIYLVDGTILNGLIKTTENLNNKIFKVFGELTNEKDAGFGFVLTSDAIFAGAIVFRDKGATYTMKYSESAKGYILIRQFSEKIGS